MAAAAQAVQQHVVAVRVDVSTSAAAIQEVGVGGNGQVGGESAEAHGAAAGHLDVADLLDDGGADVGEDHLGPVAGRAAGQGTRGHVLVALTGLVLRAVVAIRLAER